MSLQNRALSQELARKYPFFSLIQPVGGVIPGLVSFHPPDQSGPGFTRVGATLGNLSGAHPTMMDYAGRDLGRSGLSGVGADEHEELAMVRAVAEAAERYACCVVSDRDITVATANELGDDALAFEHLLRCSPAELAHPRSHVTPFDPNAVIRWVSGYSPIAKKRRLVPLVMTHLYVKVWESETIWSPISTGVAAHTDPVKAIVSAISEVVERDAIMLTWLLRLPLPRILLDEEPPADLRIKLDRLRRSKVTQYDYDATSDIGVPTVYSLQLTPGHRTTSQFVNCSSGLPMWHNIGKIIREAACGRAAEMRDPPESFDDFLNLEDGAAYMGRPERRHHFDFLTNSGRTVPISSIKNKFPESATDQYKFLIDRLSELKMDLVLVDLTTEELREAGLWVIRAVIPGLVPLTGSYRARFLGHPRIYEYAKKMGLDITSDSDVNPLPQPFA